jgi:hypothetical protein
MPRLERLLTEFRFTAVRDTVATLRSEPVGHREPAMIVFSETTA